MGLKVTIKAWLGAYMVWWHKKRRLFHPSAGSMCNEFCPVCGQKYGVSDEAFALFL